MMTPLYGNVSRGLASLRQSKASQAFGYADLYTWQARMILLEGGPSTQVNLDAVYRRGVLRIRRTILTRWRYRT